MEYKKNDIVEVEITDIGTDGEGIGKINGSTLFVKDALMGDLVEAKIVKAKKNYAYARCEKILTPSKDRVEPVCAYAKSCGVRFRQWIIRHSAPLKRERYEAIWCESEVFQKNS